MEPRAELGPLQRVYTHPVGTERHAAGVQPGIMIHPKQHKRHLEGAWRTKGHTHCTGVCSEDLWRVLPAVLLYGTSIVYGGESKGPSGPSAGAMHGLLKGMAIARSSKEVLPLNPYPYRPALYLL